MKQIEEEFNKRFKNKQLSNDGFDRDGLWAAISEDLKEKPVVLPNKNKFSNRFLLAFALLICFALTYLFFQKNTKESKAVSIAISAESKVEKTVIAAQKTNKKDISEIEKNEIQIADNQELSDRIETKSVNQYESKIELKIENSSSIFLEKNTPKLENIHVGNPIKKEQFFIQKNNANKAVISESRIAVVKNEEIGLRKQINIEIEGERPGIKPLHFLESKYMPVPSKKPSAIAFSAPYFYEKNEKQAQSPQLLFGLESGMNSIAFNSSSAQSTDAAKLKNSAEKLQPGLSLGVHAGVLLNNKWILQSGVEYHQFWSKLDIELEKNITVDKTGQLLKVWVEAGTQDTLKKEYGAVTVDAVQTRRVQHYNRYTQFAIPLQVGMQKQRNNFFYGLNLGPVLHFTTAQAGKAIDPSSEIINFEHKASTSTLSTSGLGFRLSPLLGVQVGPRLGFYLRPQWSWQGNTALFGSDMKVGVHSMNLNVGVRYAL